MIHTRFFDFCQGDKIVITFNRNTSEQFVNSIVKDIEDNNLRPYLFFNKGHNKFIPCKSFRWELKNKHRVFLYVYLKNEWNSADVFIIDCLDRNDDIGMIIWFIFNENVLRDKTVIFLCNKPYTMSKANLLDSNLVPLDTYTDAELEFNTRCKYFLATANYLLFTFDSGSRYIYLIDSEDKKNYRRFKLSYYHRELSIIKTNKLNSNELYSNVKG